VGASFGRDKVKNQLRVGALDGLRGWAALLVLILHVFFQGFPAVDFAPWQMQLWWPFSGTFAVDVFFVVSGFSIAIGYLRHGNWEELVRIGLGRYFRLGIPIFAVCALVSLMMTTGVIWPASARPQPYDTILAFEPTFSHLLKFALFDVFFSYRLSESYAGVLWTMSIEFIGTFLVIGGLLAGDALKIRAALIASFAIALLILESHYAQFFFGVMLAEVYQRGILRTKPGFGLLMVAGAGINLLFQDEWSVLLGSAIFCLGALLSPAGLEFFSSATSQRLGKISFPLYLIHGPLMFAIGVPLSVWARDDVFLMLMTGVIVTVVSIVAAFVLMPINSFSINVSRWFGGSILHLGRRLQNAKSAR
jgi:peptidoglycan/LPS O-acetylase OafA/YrhL